MYESLFVAVLAKAKINIHIIVTVKFLCGLFFDSMSILKVELQKQLIISQTYIYLCPKAKIIKYTIPKHKKIHKNLNISYSSV